MRPLAERAYKTAPVHCLSGMGKDIHKTHPNGERKMDWMMALAQHPMYFLIKEDTKCAERTPPWGEPNIEAYIPEGPVSANETTTKPSGSITVPRISALVSISSS